jgi:periplasmic protein TonB
MFDQTFVDGKRQVRKPYAVIASTVLQMVALGVSIVAPLLYTQMLPDAQLKSMLMAPLPPPPAAPKPAAIPMRKRPAMNARIQELARMIAPVKTPDRVAPIDEPPAIANLGTSGLGTDLGNTGNALLYGSTGPAAAPLAPASKIPPRAAGPLRVGGMVAEANLLQRVQPVYPALARAARVEGEVAFTAVISKEGRVENLKLVSGHPLLVAAAREAILEWRYRPTMLNGQPVEVLTTITVRFRLQ